MWVQALKGPPIGVGTHTVDCVVHICVPWEHFGDTCQLYQSPRISRPCNQKGTSAQTPLGCQLPAAYLRFLEGPSVLSLALKNQYFPFSAWTKGKCFLWDLFWWVIFDKLRLCPVSSRVVFQPLPPSSHQKGAQTFFMIFTCENRKMFGLE